LLGVCAAKGFHQAAQGCTDHSELLLECLRIHRLQIAKSMRGVDAVANFGERREGDLQKMQLVRV
jgi:hypothetical protein